MRNKKDMLLLNLLAKVFTILGLYYLNSPSGVYSFIIVFFVLIAANIKERLNKKWTILFILFQMLYFGVLIYAYQGVSSILIFITTSVNLFIVWWLPPQKMRFIGGYNSTLFLLYQISIKNWAGLLEIFVILSNFAAYLKYRRQEQTNMA